MQGGATASLRMSAHALNNVSAAIKEGAGGANTFRTAGDGETTTTTRRSRSALLVLSERPDELHPSLLFSSQPKVVFF